MLCVYSAVTQVINSVFKVCKQTVIYDRANMDYVVRSGHLCSHVWMTSIAVGQTVRLSSPGNDGALRHMTLKMPQDKFSVLWAKLPVCLQYLWLNFLFVQCIEWMCGLTRIMMSCSLKEKHWSSMNGPSIKSVFWHIYASISNGYQCRFSLVLNTFI